MSWVRERFERHGEELRQRAAAAAEDDSWYRPMRTADYFRAHPTKRLSLEEAERQRTEAEGLRREQRDYIKYVAPVIAGVLLDGQIDTNITLHKRTFSDLKARLRILNPHGREPMMSGWSMDQTIDERTVEVRHRNAHVVEGHLLTPEGQVARYVASVSPDDRHGRDFIEDPTFWDDPHAGELAIMGPDFMRERAGEILLYGAGGSDPILEPVEDGLNGLIYQHHIDPAVLG